MNSEQADEAFEYVTGTLRGEQRREFERVLANDEELQLEVQFWEQQLMTLQATGREAPPNPQTWLNIQCRLHAETQAIRADLNKKQTWLPQWLWAPGILIVVVVLSVLMFLPRSFHSTLNADYVAVLTDEAGQAQLTAITSSDSATLWLQWNELALPTSGSVQLWAVSRRDGQSRTLAIFEQEKSHQVTLDQTALRLIRDASHLLLTEEELGGSAIDEPSDIVLAKGVCVRLNDDEAQNPS